MDRFAERFDTPECARFMEVSAEIIQPILRAHSLGQVGPVRYYGSDPKGAGQLFLVFFASPELLLKVCTADGVAEVAVGSPGTPLKWSGPGWHCPSDAPPGLGLTDSEKRDLIKLEDELSANSVGWVRA